MVYDGLVNVEEEEFVELVGVGGGLPLDLKRGGGGGGGPIIVQE